MNDESESPSSSAIDFMARYSSPVRSETTRILWSAISSRLLRLAVDGVKAQESVSKLPSGLFSLSTIKAGYMALPGVARFRNLRLRHSCIDEVFDD